VASSFLVWVNKWAEYSAILPSSSVRSFIWVFDKEKKAFSELEITAEQAMNKMVITPQITAVIISAGLRVLMIDKNTVSVIWDGGSPDKLSKMK
jgi:hypothetical protein